MEPREISGLSKEYKKLMADLDNDEEKNDFNLILNVLTKIYFIFGKQPFLDRSLYEPFYLYVNQIWFLQMNTEQHDISFLLNGWNRILTKWLKLDYKNRQEYYQQINTDLLYDDD